jgi:hypothetical protein
VRSAYWAPERGCQRTRLRIACFDAGNQTSYGPEISGQRLGLELVIGEPHIPMVLLRKLLRQLNNFIQELVNRGDDT